MSMRKIISSSFPCSCVGSVWMVRGMGEGCQKLQGCHWMDECTMYGPTPSWQEKRKLGSMKVQSKLRGRQSHNTEGAWVPAPCISRISVETLLMNKSPLILFNLLHSWWLFNQQNLFLNQCFSKFPLPLILAHYSQECYFSKCMSLLISRSSWAGGNGHSIPWLVITQAKTINNQ